MAGGLTADFAEMSALLLRFFETTRYAVGSGVASEAELIQCQRGGADGYRLTWLLLLRVGAVNQRVFLDLRGMTYLMFDTSRLRIPAANWTFTAVLLRDCA